MVIVNIKKIICIILFSFTSFAYATANPILKSPNDHRTYSALTLANQMRVVLVSDPKALKSAAALTVNVGSNDDPKEFFGLAHFLEHMLFLGTKKYPLVGEFDSFLATHGGAANAYTEKEFTSYYFSVMPAQFANALDRFADFFSAPQFYPDFVDRERNAVHAEYQMRSTAAAYIEHALLNTTINPRHPASNFRIGNLQTLADTQNQSLYHALTDFYHRHYSANLMTLVLVGNQSIKQLRQLATEYFSPVINKSIIKSNTKIPAITADNVNINIHLRSKDEKRKLYLEYIIPYHKENYRFKSYEYIAYFIESEQQGTLIANLRARHLINNATVRIMPRVFGDKGIFRIQFYLTPSGQQQTDNIIATTMEYLTLIRAQASKGYIFSDLEKRYRYHYQHSHAVSALELAKSLSKSMLYYPLQHIVMHPYVIEKHKQKRILKAFAAINPNNMRVWTISPDEVTDRRLKYFPDGHFRITAINKQQRKAWLTDNKSALKLPLANKLLSDDETLVKKTIVDKPENTFNQKNVSLWQMHSKQFTAPQSVLVLELNSNLPLAKSNARLLKELLINYFALSVSDLLEEARTAQISTDISGRNGLSIAIFGRSQKQTDYLRLLIDRLLTMAITESVFKVQKHHLINTYRAQSKDYLYQKAYRFLRDFISDRYVTPNNAIATIDQIDRKALKQFKDVFLDSVNLQLFSYGNISKQQGIILSRDLSQKFKRKDNQRTHPVYKSFVKGQIHQLTYVSEQNDIALIDSYFPNLAHHSARARIKMLAQLTHPDFFNQLRTEEQFGYALAISEVGRDSMPGIGIMVQTAKKQPEVILKRIAQFKQEHLQTLRGLSETNFTRVKEAIIANYNQAPRTLFDEAIRFTQDWREGNYDFDSRYQFTQALKKLTKEATVQFYDDFLIQGKGTRVIVQLQPKMSEAQ